MSAQILEGSTLWAVQTAIGRGMTQAEHDSDFAAFTRLTKAKAALLSMDAVCRGYVLDECEERLVRETLLDLVERHGELTPSLLLPVVQFVRSCKKSEFSK